MVPSLALIRQTLGEWHLANSKPFRYLCVCSDSTVTAQTDDSWIVNPSDLDCRVTTAAADVVTFLGAPSLLTKVIFCTYQSGAVLADALSTKELSKFIFDLAICDEAHRLAGPAIKSFNHILGDENIRASKRLFMTATPRIIEPINQEPTDDISANVFSMDDENMFGPTIYYFGFRQAIEEKVICDYRVVVIGVSEEEALDHNKENGTVKTTDAGKWSIEGLAQRIALGKAISTYSINKIFSFHHRVDAASRFVDRQLPDSFPSVMAQIAPTTDFLASHISGVMPAGRRAKILRDFRDAKRGVISNAKCLGEGVNVPDVDGVFFSDPKNSVIDIVQSTGRALRRRPDKAIAYIIIPVLMRKGEDPDRLLKASRFDSVWKVLSAMLSQDDRLQATLAQTLIAKGHDGNLSSTRTSATRTQGLPDYRTILLGFPKDLPLSEYQRLFTLEAVEKTGDRWFVRFGALKKYMETYGQEPTQQTEFEGINLGTWLKSQREAFKQDKLGSDRSKLISELGISLSTTALAQFKSRQRAQWAMQLAACYAFLKANGRLPFTNEVSPTGLKSGEWLAHQRVSYRKKKLSKEDIEAFEGLLGPAWEPRNEHWDRKFEAYKNYVTLTAKQPGKHTSHNGVNIGLWLYRLRQDSDSLSPEQIARLNATGMRWIRDPLDPSSQLSPSQERKRLAHDVRQERERLERIAHQSDDEWFTYYYRYKEFIGSLTESSDLPKPANGRSVTDEQSLKEWLHIQRELALENKLPENRTRSLGLLTQYILDSRLSAKKYGSSDGDEQIP